MTFKSSCLATILFLSVSTLSAPIAQAAGPAGGLTRIDICHGYSCAYRSKLPLSAQDGRRLREIMSAGAASPAAERMAISRAIRYFEERAFQVTGVRDKPKTQIGAARIRGQMDCIDESTNTTTLLSLLAKRGLLKHHRVESRDSRGFLLDGRYPHWTAIVSERNGVKWAVDSWYGPMGAAPDIMLLSDWKRRGFAGG